MYVHESDFFGTFLFKFHKAAFGISVLLGVVTVSSQHSYFPGCEFDIKNEGGFILRTSSLTS
jgi:hypothetical protein